MQPTEANNSGKRVIFIAIGLALLGLVVFGVVWAKNRAEQVASTSESVQQTEGDTQVEPDPTVDEEGIASTEPSTETESQIETETEGHVAAAQDSNTVVTTEIPAAGPTNTLVTTVMLGILVFAVVKFVQSEILGRRV